MKKTGTDRSYHVGKAIGTFVYLLGSIASFKSDSDVTESKDATNLSSLAKFFKSDSDIKTFLSDANQVLQSNSIEESAVGTLVGSIATGAYGLYKYIKPDEAKPIYRITNKLGGRELGYNNSVFTSNYPALYKPNPTLKDHDYNIEHADGNYFYFFNVSQERYIHHNGTKLILSTKDSKIKTKIEIVSSTDMGARFVNLKLENGLCIRVEKGSETGKELETVACDSNDPSTFWQLIRTSTLAMPDLKDVEITD